MGDIINLTNHEFKEFISGMTVPVCGLGVARVECKKEIIHRNPLGFNISKTVYGKIVGLDVDNIDPNKLYIVSAVVLNALQDKGLHFDNVVAPAETIRDDDGNVVGAKGFRVNG
jgi:hypothetical protein